MKTYESLDDATFANILRELVDTMTPASLLAIPGVYELVAEELNNEVLTIWEESAEVQADEEEDEEDEA